MMACRPRGRGVQYLVQCTDHVHPFWLPGNLLFEYQHLFTEFQATAAGEQSNQSAGRASRGRGRGRGRRGGGRSRGRGRGSHYALLTALPADGAARGASLGLISHIDSSDEEDEPYGDHIDVVGGVGKRYDTNFAPKHEMGMLVEDLDSCSDDPD